MNVLDTLNASVQIKLDKNTPLDGNLTMIVGNDETDRLAVFQNMATQLTNKGFRIIYVTDSNDEFIKEHQKVNADLFIDSDESTVYKLITTLYNQALERIRKVCNTRACTALFLDEQIEPIYLFINHSEKYLFGTDLVASDENRRMLEDMIRYGKKALVNIILTTDNVHCIHDLVLFSDMTNRLFVGKSKHAFENALYAANTNELFIEFDIPKGKVRIDGYGGKDIDINKIKDLRMG